MSGAHPHCLLFAQPALWLMPPPWTLVPVAETTSDNVVYKPPPERLACTRALPVYCHSSLTTTKSFLVLLTDGQSLALTPSPASTTEF